MDCARVAIVALLLTTAVCSGAAASTGDAISFPHIPALQGAGQPQYAEGRLLLRLRQTHEDQVAAAAATLPPGIQLDRAIASSAGAGGASIQAAAAAAPARPVLLCSITDGSRVQDKVHELLSNPAVEHAEPDYLYRLHLDRAAQPEALTGAAATEHCASGGTPAGGCSSGSKSIGRRLHSDVMPNDARYSLLWHLPKVSAPQAWARTTGARQTKVCVIDTGARETHQDLSANLANPGWNRGCTACNTSADPLKDMPAVKSPAYFDYNDLAGHGTAVAGLLGAVGNNQLGVAGVSWQVSMHICRAAMLSGELHLSGILDCLNLCKKQGVRVVSASFGSYRYSQFEFDAIKQLNQAGILLVASAGNDQKNVDGLAANKRPYPASYALDNIVSVAATDSADKLTSFSNYGGKTVHLAAPGMDVLTTWYTSDSAYAYSSGTSMSAPLVAGAAALLWSSKPTATAANVRQALLSSVDRVPALAGKVTTNGRLNVAAAQAALLGVPLRPPSPPPTRRPPAAPQPWYQFVGSAATPSIPQAGLLKYIPYVPSGNCASVCAKANLVPLKEPRGQEVCVTRSYYQKQFADFFDTPAIYPPNDFTCGGIHMFSCVCHEQRHTSALTWAAKCPPEALPSPKPNICLIHYEQRNAVGTTLGANCSSYSYLVAPTIAQNDVLCQQLPRTYTPSPVVSPTLKYLLYSYVPTELSSCSTACKAQGLADVKTVDGRGGLCRDLGVSLNDLVGANSYSGTVVQAASGHFLCQIGTAWGAQVTASVFHCLCGASGAPLPTWVPSTTCDAAKHMVSTDRSLCSITAAGSPSAAGYTGANFFSAGVADPLKYCLIPERPWGPGGSPVSNVTASSALQRHSLCFNESITAVRLQDGDRVGSGRVEVKIGGQFGAVSQILFDNAAARLVCRKLGYTGGRALANSFFGVSGLPMLITETACFARYASLEQCGYSTVPWVPAVEMAGDGKREAGVRCNTKAVTSVKLAGGPSKLEGRLEVQVGGQWSTVCKPITPVEAEVVCRMLKLAGGQPTALYASGTLPRLVDRVSCTGAETSLNDCLVETPDNWQATCGDAALKVAGVRCSSAGSVPWKQTLLGSQATVNGLLIYVPHLEGDCTLTCGLLGLKVVGSKPGMHSCRITDVGTYAGTKADNAKRCPYPGGERVNYDCVCIEPKNVDLLKPPPPPPSPPPSLPPSVYCWGSGDSYVLGNGQTDQVSTPVPVAGGAQGLSFDSVSLGIDNSCGLLAGTKLAYCWGKRVDEGIGADTYDPTPTAVPGGLKFSILAVGYYHTCGLLADGSGKAYCWGNGDSGQLGTGKVEGSVRAPVAVQGGHAFSSISVGSRHTCAVLAQTGKAMCWGQNTMGQIGSGSTTAALAPVAVQGDFTFKSVVANDERSCGILTDGGAACWGSNIMSALCIDDPTQTSTVPVRMAGQYSFSQLTMGSMFTCGLVAETGAAVCCGNGFFGMTGLGDTMTVGMPQPVVGGHTFSQIAAGSLHTCALLADGSGQVLCWGRGARGSLGAAGTEDISVPKLAVGGSPKFRSIAGGAYHNCGVV